MRTAKLNEVLTLKNGTSSPPRHATGIYEVLGANGNLGRADVSNVSQACIVIGRVGSAGSIHFSSAACWVTDNAMIAHAANPKSTLFWFYLLHTLDLPKRSHGSSHPLLNQNILGEIEVLVPSDEEQDAIAEVLGALDDKIAANSRVIETSMQLGETLARRYATAPKPLEDIATITMGTSPKGEFLNEQGEGLPFYQGVRDFGVISPTERVFTESPVRTTPAGSILFAVRAPVGEVNLAPSETAIGRGVAGFHSEAQTATMFFGLRVFASIWDQFDGGGTVFSSVTAAEVRTAMLPMPSDEEASRVEQTLSALLTRATAANQENIVLARTRDELLPLLMSGRMKVGDVQARVEEVM